MAVYAIFGLVAGICLGIFLWLAFRFAEKSPDSRRLSIFYLSLMLSFILFVNLIIWLDRKNVTSDTSGLLIDLGLMVGALIFAALIYKLGCVLIGKRSLGDDKAVSSEVLIQRSKIALLSVGLIISLALALNQWVFRWNEITSEIFAYQTNHNNRVINPNDKNINVILISIDTLRADHLSCYGYHRKTSPNIDRLAREGVMFSKAFSTTSWTLPAHISMFTSMYAKSHGVITADYALDENRVTLAEALKKEGYTTAAFISGAFLRNPRFGFDQGFDLYDASIINQAAPPGDVVQASRVVISPKLNEVVQRWLGKNYRKKFFLFLHSFDVHSDYVPSPPYNTMFDPDYKGTIDGADLVSNPRVNPKMNPKDLEHIIALYDGEIAFTDKYIGELLSALKELDIYDKTLIVLTADHGEEFFEHGHLGHKRSLYDEVLHVPLIFKFPSSFKLRVNRKFEEVASIIDIMPTILNSIGIKPHEEMQGKSLLSIVTGNKKPNDSLAYSRFEYKLVAVRSANWKLIHHLETPKKEFYDLVNDPREKINLYDKGTKSIAEGERHLISLLDWLNTQQQFSQVLPKADGKEIELSDEIKEELKSLGYIQ